MSVCEQSRLIVIKVPCLNPLTAFSLSCGLCPHDRKHIYVLQWSFTLKTLVPYIYVTTSQILGGKIKLNSRGVLKTFLKHTYINMPKANKGLTI